MNSDNRRYKPYGNGAGSNPAQGDGTRQSVDVEVKPTMDGWLFVCGDRSAGPFKDLEQIDCVAVAAQLNGLDEAAVEEWKRAPGEDKERWLVQPKGVLRVVLQLEACVSRRRSAQRGEGETAEGSQISKLDAELVGKRVQLNAQVVSEQAQKALPRKLIIRCARCGGEFVADLLSQENKGLLQSVIFGDRERLRKQAEVHLVGEVGPECGKKPTHRVVVEEDGFMDYAILGARDPLEEVEKFDQQVFTSKRVHLVGVKIPPSKKIRLRGSVVVNPSTRDICVLADSVEPLETQIAGFQITDKDRAGWPKWFNTTLDIDNQVAPDMVGRKDVQHAYLLLLHSVPVVPDIHGRLIRGCLRVLCFGDSKTYKSESAKDLTINHYGFGGYVVAESSSRTGITYTIDTENKAVVWGELPNNDLGLAVLDGLHSMYGEEVKELRECLENQRIIVRRSVCADALARTRSIGIFNPNKPMNQYLYPCMAVKDNPTFYDPPDITRWDIFVPFAKEDVPEEKVVGRKPERRPIPEELFKRHVYWAWSRKPEHVQYTDEAGELIVSASTDLMKTYALSSLPIVHLGVRDVLCRLSVAQACLNHSTDETHSMVIVGKEHVEAALRFYKDMLGRLRLREYKIEEEGKVEITPSELEEMVGALTERQMSILNSIKIHSKSSTALAEELDVSVETIKRDYKTLRYYGLITTTPKVGVALTARGVQFLKALKQGNSVIASKNDTNTLNVGTGDKSDVEEIASKNDTITLNVNAGERPIGQVGQNASSKGQGGSEADGEPGSKEGLTSKGGDIRDFRDVKALGPNPPLTPKSGCIGGMSGREEELPKGLRIPPGLEEYMRIVQVGKELWVECLLCASMGKRFYTVNIKNMADHIKGWHKVPISFPGGEEGT